MTPGGATLRLAASDADYASFGEVCRAYVTWSRERYRDMPWFVEEVFGHQALDGELKVLPAKYGPPDGRVMVAEADGHIVAGGAYRRTDAATCELKRLYVTDLARSHGLGRRLTEALVSAARADGFTTMKLDTGDRLSEAIALYASMGFRRIEPYHAYPERLLPHLVFMERTL